MFSAAWFLSLGLYVVGAGEKQKYQVTSDEPMKILSAKTALEHKG